MEPIQKLKVEMSSSKCGVDPKTNETDLLISLKPPTGKRTPIDVCCIVDVSGSMGLGASLRNQKGDRESHGLSLLDVVKHAMSTIIHLLEPQDRLALVVFSDNVTIWDSLLEMNQNGKDLVLCHVENLYPQQSTNLWGGLRAGLDILYRQGKKTRFSTIILLTDGQPNVIPKEGDHIQALRNYLNVKKVPCTINTFGFGYNLKPQLLSDLAREGNGIYSFIPDSSFVGTVFVNCISHLLCTMSKNTLLTLKTFANTEIVQDNNYVGLRNCTSQEVQLSMGPLAFEQSRDLVIRVKIPKELIGVSTKLFQVSVKYEDVNGSDVEVSENAIQWVSQNDVILKHIYRLKAVQVMQELLRKTSCNELPLNTALVESLVEEIKQSLVFSSEEMKGLIEDLSGQVLESIENEEAYEKWGVHYLPSLSCAHSLQFCNNFKDPGVQFYGCKLFEEIRDKAEEIFMKIPPPSSSQDLPSMNVYYCNSNPCFHPECLVEMKDGSKKKVMDVSKGDWIKTASEKEAQVICVVKTICKDGVTDLVELGDGLLVTPYHPILHNNEWHFPNTLQKAKTVACPAVFNFVLDTEHTMNINGVSCVTLGHHFTDNEVVAHPYFGTKKVVNDLQKISGWKDGLIVLQSGCILRHRETNLVCAIVSPST